MIKKLNTDIFKRTGVFSWFFLFYSIFGIYTISKFGVPLDELTQRFIGIENNRFISGSQNIASIEKNGFFGPVFESASYLLEQTFYNASFRTKLVMRHLLLFLIFLGAVRCFYLISRVLFRSQKIAGISTILLALNPWLFAHSHYNSKDTFFLCLLIYLLYFFQKFLLTQKKKNLVLSSIFIGMAVSVRFSGLIFLLVLVCYLLYFYKKERRKLFINAGLFILLSILSLYLFFPYLWVRPIQGIVNIWNYTTHNPWPSSTLILGKVIFPGHYPWWYLPVWMGVTIPVCTLFMAAVGIVYLLKKKYINEHSFGIVLLVLFIFPLLLVMTLKPTLYDGWRHFQFLLVPLAFMVGYGYLFFAKYRMLKYGFNIVLVYTFYQFFVFYKTGYVYMNEIYSNVIQPNTFTQDYWGLSGRNSLEWIAQKKKVGKISVYCFTESAKLNAYILTEKQASRFNFVQTPDSADYIIEFKRQRYFERNRLPVVYSICPQKDTIVRVLQK